MERREESVCGGELGDRRVMKRKREDARQAGEGCGRGHLSFREAGAAGVGNTLGVFPVQVGQCLSALSPAPASKVDGSTPSLLPSHPGEESLSP